MAVKYLVQLLPIANDALCTDHLRISCFSPFIYIC